MQFKLLKVPLTLKTLVSMSIPKKQWLTNFSNHQQHIVSHITKALLFAYPESVRQDWLAQAGNSLSHCFVYNTKTPLTHYDFIKAKETISTTEFDIEVQILDIISNWLKTNKILELYKCSIQEILYYVNEVIDEQIEIAESLAETYSKYNKTKLINSREVRNAQKAISSANIIIIKKTR